MEITRKNIILNGLGHSSFSMFNLVASCMVFVAICIISAPAAQAQQEKLGPDQDVYEKAFLPRKAACEDCIPQSKYRNAMIHQFNDIKKKMEKLRKKFPTEARVNDILYGKTPIKIRLQIAEKDGKDNYGFSVEQILSDVEFLENYKNNNYVRPTKRMVSFNNKRFGLTMDLIRQESKVWEADQALRKCEEEKCKKPDVQQDQHAKLGVDQESAEVAMGIRGNHGPVSISLGAVSYNFKGLNEPRNKSVDLSDPSTLKGVSEEESQWGGEAVIRYKAPNSKYYLEGGIFGANGFGASEYFHEEMIDIDVMREMDFIGLKVGGGITGPIIQSGYWFYSAGAGAVVTKATTEFTINYKFDGNVVESMSSKASRTSGSPYVDIGLMYNPLGRIGGGVKLQVFQLGMHDPKFDEDSEDIVWGLGAHLTYKF